MTSPHKPDAGDDAGDNFDADFAAAFGFSTGESSPFGSSSAERLSAESSSAASPTGQGDFADLEGALATLSRSLELASPVPAGRPSRPEAIIPNVEPESTGDPALPQMGLSRESSVAAAHMSVMLPGVPIKGSVRLEFCGSADAGVGLKSTIPIRLVADSTTRQFEIRVESDLPVSPNTFSGRCTAAGLYDAGSLRFVPQTAGSDELRFELILLDEAGIRSARMTGSLPIHVAPSQNQQSIQAGGDVIIFGGRTPEQRPGAGKRHDPEQQWRDIPLLEDAAFRTRAERYRPRAGADRPQDLAEAVIASRTNGVLYCRCGNSGPVCHGIAFGNETSLGRGGDEEVQWWIRPEANCSEFFGKLSRKHITLQLRNGYAWVIEQSANGTSLNGSSLTKGRREILSDGDQLTLAGEMSFSVRLSGSEQRVSSIELRRLDGLREFSTIILALPGSPHRIDTGQGEFWTACAETGEIRLKLNSGPWENAADGVEFELGDGVRTVWYAFDGAVDQDQLF